MPRASGTAEPDTTYLRSLMLSGALGLVLASFGTALVGRRRRQW
jgi:hypothetical protein